MTGREGRLKSVSPHADQPGTVEGDQEDAADGDDGDDETARCDDTRT